MSFILSFTDTALLSSVRICCTTVAILMCHCYSNWEPVLTHLFSEFPVVADAAARGPQAFPICLHCLWLLLLRVSTQCSCIGLLWWGELRGERPPRWFLGSSLCSSPLQFFFRMAAAPIWRWTKFTSFYYGAIVAARRKSRICLFRAFPMQVTTTATQTLRGLLTVGPDMAKVLAVVVLRKASVNSV
jgi:hypothetical protein